MRKMMQKARIGILTILSLQVGCDPGFDYEPENWAPSGAYVWEYKSEEFDIQTHSLGGLIGSTTIGLELDVTNHADSPLLLEEAVLVVEDGNRYQVHFHDDLKWRTVAAKRSGRLNLFWGFQQPAATLLGERPRLILEFRRGDESYEVRIEYRKVE